MRALKSILIILTLIVVPMVVVSSVAAQTVDPFAPVCDGSTQDASACQQDGDDPISGADGILTKALIILSWVSGVAAVIMVILGGFKYVTSGGDPNSIASAKNTVLYAVVGLVVFALSQTIVIFVIRKV